MKLLATSIASLLLMNSLIAQAAPAAENGVAQPAKVYGRYIEARSDFAWENDLVAFRAYGPKLRDGEENAGIDCWLKRVTYPIIDKWYRQETEQQISYHQDHGEGLDNFQVGSSLGVGGTGIMINDKLELLETFTQYTIKKQTDKELVFTLTYQNKIGEDTYREEKTISLKLHQRLFRVESQFWKNGELAVGLPIAIGLTTHDAKATPMSDYDAGWAATWEVMDDAALGTGIVFDPKRVSLVNLYRSQPGPSGHHLLAVSATDKNGKIAYAAGYGWSKAGVITSPEKWTEYLAAFKL